MCEILIMQNSFEDVMIEMQWRRRTEALSWDKSTVVCSRSRHIVAHIRVSMESPGGIGLESLLLKKKLIESSDPTLLVEEAGGPTVEGWQVWSPLHGHVLQYYCNLWNPGSQTFRNTRSNSCASLCKTTTQARTLKKKSFGQKTNNKLDWMLWKWGRITLW